MYHSKADPQKTFELKNSDASVLSAAAHLDHTSVEVIRPGTAMLRIDLGKDIVPAAEAPVLSVANAPPKA